MDGQALAMRTRGRWRPKGAWQTAALASAFFTVAALAILVVARRLDGSLRAPLPPLALLAVGLALAVWIYALVVGAGRQRHGAALLVTAAIAAAFAVGVWLPGTSLWGACLLWAPIAGASAAARLSGRRRASAKSATAFDESAAADDSTLPGDDVLAQLVRRREADGTESIHGFVRATFAAGQQTAAAHVAFCPPCRTPVVCDAEQADGPPARVRVGQVVPHGARIDVRLDRPADGQQSVLVELAARAGSTAAS